MPIPETVVSQLVDICISYINRPQTRNKIKVQVMDPLVSPCVEYIARMFFPYIMVIVISTVAVLMLFFAVFWFLVSHKSSSSLVPSNV